MRKFLILSAFLLISVLLIGSVPCQGDDEWSELCDHETAAIATDSPYVYILVPHDSVYRSTDGGSNWQLRADTVSSNWEFRWPQAISIDPVDPDFVFSGFSLTNALSANSRLGSRSPMGIQLYRSTDGGSNWTLVDEDTDDAAVINCIANDPGDSSIVFCGRGIEEKVRRSTDRGVNWGYSSYGLTSAALSLAFDLDDADILYAGTEDSGVYKTTSARNGVSWNSTGLTSKEVRSVVVNPSNTSVLFAATTDDVWRSSDGGTNWDRIAGDHDYTFNSLALNPKYPNILYALHDDDHLYFYYDGRSSDWIDISSGLPTGEINHLVSDLGAAGSKVVFAASDSGVYKHDEEENKEFIRGDAKADDGDADVVDYVFLYNYVLFSGEAPPCMDAADVDDDGDADIADVVYLYNFIYQSGPAPPQPYGTFPDSCGTDPTSDDLNCIYSPCYGQ